MNTQRDLNGALEFTRVLECEREYLNNRPEVLDATGKLDSQTDHFSICFSGGGIRSAAFNLGVLQALAEKKLLGKINYLSTVSGGGYIGSWFMALLERSDSIQDVQDLINPAHKSRKEANEKAEPRAIAHLRTHSNYLAPKVGVFSTDLWALWAIYLRNTFLNALVLTPLLLAVIFFLRYFRFFQTVRNTDARIPTAHLVIGVLCAVAACALIGWSLYRCRTRAKLDPQSVLKTTFVDSFWIPVLLFALATAFVGAAVRYYKEFDSSHIVGHWFDTGAFAYHAFWVVMIGGVTQVLAFNFRSIQMLFKKYFGGTRKALVDAQPLRWIFSGFLGGGTLAFVLYVLAVFFPLLVDEKNQHQVDAAHGNPTQAFSKPVDKLSYADYRDDLLDDWWISFLVGSLTPFVLLSFGIAQSLQVGVLGSLETREVREKWSFLNAYCAVAGLGWFGAFLLGVVLPDWIYGQLVHGKYAMPTGLGTMGVTTLGTAVWIAQSLWAGKSKRTFLDAFVKIGPYIALGLGFILVGLLAKWIIHDPFEVFGQLVAGHRSLYLLSACLAVSLVASRYVDVNIFSLQEMYENRLVCAFLGASQPNRVHADPVTHIDPTDDLRLCEVGFEPEGSLSGPIHLINTTINLSGIDRREYDERKGDSFILSPLFCGSELTGYRKTGDGYGGNLTLGRAFSTSGAAVSPNMGYYSTAAVTALLTFCNLRLGGWFPNPSSKFYKEPGPRFGWIQIVREILGYTDATEDFVYLSDGGHFDNLGAYELVRRRCKKIYICDAGADPKGACHELALLIRKVRIDFGVTIEIDVTELKRSEETGFSQKQVAIGKIKYPADYLGGQQDGEIVYLKLDLVEGDSTDLRSYQIKNPDFPHQSTLNQFYSESQFESYRFLGYSSAIRCF